MTTNLPDYDIAIVGGGTSGIYTAWRMLLEADSSPKLKGWKEKRGRLKIGIFEKSKRIGGRILSAKAPGLPDVVCEIGGMRFVSSQQLVQGLVQNKLKLPVHEQTVDDPHNIILLRGKYLRESQLSDPDVLPYQFTDEETQWLKSGNNNAGSNFLGYAIEKLLPDILKHIGPGLRDYLDAQKIDGIPLYKHGFWNVIAPYLSHEAYRIAVTTVGYDCLGFNTNAVDAICEYFDFTPGVKYYLLNEGYESVFWTLQKQFVQHGGEVIMQKSLTSFNSAALADGSTGVSLHFENETQPVSARAVVLAMPRRSLELLEQKGPVLDPQIAPHFQFLLNSVAPIHLYKMFIAYNEPWWEKEGVTAGRSLTDIPIRQCYYWGTEGKQQGADPNNTNAILMVYNDALSSDFWGGLRHIPLGPGDAKLEDSPLAFKPKTNLLHTAAVKQNEWDNRLNANWKKCVAPKAMVKEMHRQLMILHNVTDAPEPLEAAFVDWGDDPFGGAVHFWNPGYQSSEILQKMIQPVEDFPCYICGEAYSTNQTWVEGALQTAELVLRKFDISEPDWITKS
ncbi:flavin monoamine oxidase family protein [Parafilimonas terrae]|uniref:Tryptophan 2-monooxygenase n=1 Tax=Parafilimonas terrae TaxID=1465490 RepID=A0A1I5VPC6_9BACT|nr:FAD-dependent oxidoreductase [Parafilimonas terrae]SFQ09359.1 Monoamine oxidase [Parafilimonas terrae]